MEVFVHNGTVHRGRCFYSSHLDKYKIRKLFSRIIKIIGPVATDTFSAYL